MQFSIGYITKNEIPVSGFTQIGILTCILRWCDWEYIRISRTICVNYLLPKSSGLPDRTNGSRLQPFNPHRCCRDS
jgi:hypothetical protein